MTRDQAYKACETLTIALHELIALGLGDEYESDLIREALDCYSKDLWDGDIKKLNDFSGDLYDRRKRKEWMKKYICNEMFVCGVIGGIMWGVAIALACMII